MIMYGSQSSAVANCQSAPPLRQSRRTKVQTTHFEARLPIVASTRATKDSVAFNKKALPKYKRAPFKRSLPCDSDTDSDGAPATKKGKASSNKKVKDKGKGKGKEVDREHSSLVEPLVDEYATDSTERECCDEPIPGRRMCNDSCSCHKSTGYETRCIVDSKVRRERCIEELRVRHSLQIGLPARRMVNGIRSQLEIAKRSTGLNESFLNLQLRFRMEATIIQYEMEEAGLEYEFSCTYAKIGAVRSNTTVDPFSATEEEAAQETATFPVPEMHPVDRTPSVSSNTTIDLISASEDEVSRATSTFTTPERNQITDGELNAFERPMKATIFLFNMPGVTKMVSDDLKTHRMSEGAGPSQCSGASSPQVVGEAPSMALVDSTATQSHQKMQKSTLMDLAAAAERSQQLQVPAFNFDPLPIFHPPNFATSSLRQKCF